MANYRENKMKLFRVVRKLNILGANESGVGLIETAVALAVLGIIAVSVFTGLSTASKSTFTADQRNTAQSLAQSQVEFVKDSDYINFSDFGHDDYGLIAAADGYSIESLTIPINPDTGEALPSGQDLGLQKIVVTVEHYGDSVCTLESYKGER
jgi:type II secretory pathway pseudopilin PulG